MGGVARSGSYPWRSNISWNSTLPGRPPEQQGFDAHESSYRVEGTGPVYLCIGAVNLESLQCGVN